MHEADYGRSHESVIGLDINLTRIVTGFLLDRLCGIYVYIVVILPWDIYIPVCVSVSEQRR